MTYLQLINKVLRGLREPTIESLGVTDEDYVLLVGQLVNEAKEEIEDLGPWYGLRTTVNKVTTVDVSTVSLTTETNDRSYLLYTCNRPQAFITTLNEEHRLIVIEQGDMDALYALEPSPDSNVPVYVSFSRASGGMTAQFWPIPDAAYNVRFILVIPQDDLTTASQTLSIPAGPVWREALVRAMEERGEEFAGPLEGARLRARESLGSAIMMDFGTDNLTFERE